MWLDLSDCVGLGQLIWFKENRLTFTIHTFSLLSLIQINWSFLKFWIFRIDTLQTFNFKKLSTFISHKLKLYCWINCIMYTCEQWHIELMKLFFYSGRAVTNNRVFVFETDVVWDSSQYIFHNTSLRLVWQFDQCKILFCVHCNNVTFGAGLSLVLKVIIVTF